MKHIGSARVSRVPQVDPSSSLVSPLAFTDVTAECQDRQRYVSRRELRRLFPVSDMTIWRWMGDPEVAFPRPIKFGNGRNFWWLPEIIDWERRRAMNSSISRKHDVEPQEATRGLQ